MNPFGLNHQLILLESPWPIQINSQTDSNLFDYLFNKCIETKIV